MPDFSLVYLGRGVVDIDVYDVGACIKRKVPDVLDDHGPGDSPSRIAHQILQKTEFLRSELDAASSSFYPAFYSVQLKIVYR